MIILTVCPPPGLIVYMCVRICWVFASAEKSGRSIAFDLQSCPPSCSPHSGTVYCVLLSTYIRLVRCSLALDTHFPNDIVIGGKQELHIGSRKCPTEEKKGYSIPAHILQRINRGAVTSPLAHSAGDRGCERTKTP